MIDLLDEVQQDLKEEKYHNIVKKISRFFIIFAIIVVIAASIYTWKEHVSNQLQNNLGIWYSKAASLTDENKLDEAIMSLDKILEHPHQQYAALAYLNKAAILFKQNKNTEAENILLEITKQDHFNIVFKDLAQIIYLGKKLNSNDNIEEVDKILLSMSQDNKPWQLSSLELQALYDIKRNKIQDAKEALNKIANSQQVSSSSKDSALSILSVISRIE